MARELTVRGTTYQYPAPGENPDWSEGASDWAAAVSDALGDLLNGDDILRTSFVIENGKSSATNITGLIFDPTQVRAAFIRYSVYRSTDSDEVVEAGIMFAAYKDDAAEWIFSREYVGSSGLTFSVATNGQFKYTSDSLSGANYSGVMKFSASTLPT